MPSMRWIGFSKYPIFASNGFVVGSDIPASTARRVLNALIDNGVLEVLRVGSGRRPAILLFQDVLDVAEGRAPVDAHA